MAASANDAPAAPVQPACCVRDLLPTASDQAIALTFDDGPDVLWTPQLLDLLARIGIKATFCVIGLHARAHPELVRRIVAEGHGLANHSMTHPQPFSGRSPAAIRRQISDAQSAIADACGLVPRLFRAPFGDWAAPVVAATRGLALARLGWSIDPLDWSRPGIELITVRLSAAQSGDILLCHDGGGDRSQTLASLRTVLPALQDRGLQFVAL